MEISLAINSSSVIYGRLVTLAHFIPEEDGYERRRTHKGGHTRDVEDRGASSLAGSMRSRFGSPPIFWGPENSFGPSSDARRRASNCPSTTPALNTHPRYASFSLCPISRSCSRPTVSRGPTLLSFLYASRTFVLARGCVCVDKKRKKKRKSWWNIFFASRFLRQFFFHRPTDRVIDSVHYY